MKNQSIKFLLFLMLMVPTSLFAQETNINSEPATLRIVYAFSQNNLTDTTLSRTDTMALDIGDRLSMFYDLTKAPKDSLLMLKFKSGNTKSVSIIKNDGGGMSQLFGDNTHNNENIIKTNDYISFIIYKYRIQKRVYTLHKGSKSSISVFLAEDMPPQEWSISTDTCTILDYLCQKAVTKFRGREYEVYFTQEIPVNEGPWKLYGLPGLILEAKTKDGLFSFKAIGNQKIDNKPIEISYSKKTEVCKNLKQYHKYASSLSQKENYMIDNDGYIMLFEKISSNKPAQLEIDY